MRRETRRATFDVICAGEPLWKLARVDDSLRRSNLRFESGVVNIAQILARAGVRVGLATVFEDDTFGRTVLQRIAAMGIDIGGVRLALPGRALLVVDGGGGQSGVVSDHDPERELEVPAEWSSRVLLLSGVSPITASAAALCKAARKARREGISVVLDVNANLRLWAGCDPRIISMVLREADVVRCSIADLAVVGMDAASVRRAMRPNAALVLNDPSGVAASGPFGEVKCSLPALPAHDTTYDENGGDSCTAGICAELARPRPRAESPSGRWHRVLERWASTVAM